MPIGQQSFFDFHYEDEDNLFEEINEFYAFQEVEQLAENLRMWQQSGDFGGGRGGASTVGRSVGRLVALLMITAACDRLDGCGRPGAQGVRRFAARKLGAPG